MLKLEDIEDSLIEDVKANITGVMTCDTHEESFTEETLRLMGPRQPFVLIRYVETQPVESERESDGGAGSKTRSFVLSVGASSFRSQKGGQRGCYALLDDIRERYKSFNLAVGSDAVVLTYDGDSLLYSKNGVNVYAVLLSWNEE